MRIKTLKRNTSNVIKKTIEARQAKVSQINLNLNVLLRQKKDVERELHDLNDDLEIRIGERTAALEHAIRDLESFNYTVSHDLRAPLRAINGFATVLTEHIDGDLEPEATESLDAIRRNATAMSRLLDDLLAFSRLSRRDVGTGTVDVSAVAREVVRETIDPEDLPATEIRVAETPRATADEELVRQLIAHLLDNALKYSRSRTRRIVEFVGRTDGAAVMWSSLSCGASSPVLGPGSRCAFWLTLWRPSRRRSCSDMERSAASTGGAPSPAPVT